MDDPEHEDRSQEKQTGLGLTFPLKHLESMLLITQEIYSFMPTGVFKELQLLICILKLRNFLAKKYSILKEKNPNVRQKM